MNDMNLQLAFVTIALLINSTGAIECYRCTNATYVSECQALTTCNSGEVCFLEHVQTENGISYTLGCRQEAICGTVINSGNNIGSGSLVGRSGVTGPCSECCKEQHCNRELCQHSYYQCTDSTEIHCASVGALVDICSDTNKANKICRRFCGLCNYVNGQWSSWFSWSECDVTCGKGTQTRTRNCSEPAPSGGGQYCTGQPQETQSCTKEPCPIHGSWTDWTLWGSCSASCGIGLKRRDRTCANPYPARFGDHCFGDSRDDQLCLASSCPDGGWSTWQTWSTCSRTCGDGIMTRSRSCDNPLPSIQGRYCQGDPYQVETCNMKSCPVTHGVWGLWTTWTSCTASCNGGLQTRQRQCNSPKPSAGGDFCDGTSSDVRSCNQQQCPITHGGWGLWTTWTSCTASCNGGLQTRQRHCNSPKPSAGGDFCDGTSSDVRSCNQQQCPNIKASFLVNEASRGSDGILRWGRVFLNEGSFFNIATGIFTCKYPGFYVFIANLIEGGRDKNLVACKLRKNNVDYVKLWSEQGKINGDYAKDGYGSVTGAATQHLMTGDTVHVYCDSFSGTSLSHSSFTGFLLSNDP